MKIMQMVVLVVYTDVHGWMLYSVKSSKCENKLNDQYMKYEYKIIWKKGNKEKCFREDVLWCYGHMNIWKSCFD